MSEWLSGFLKIVVLVTLVGKLFTLKHASSSEWVGECVSASAEKHVCVYIYTNELALN